MTLDPLHPSNYKPIIINHPDDEKMSSNEMKNIDDEKKAEQKLKEIEEKKVVKKPVKKDVKSSRRVDL